MRNNRDKATPSRVASWLFVGLTVFSADAQAQNVRHKPVRKPVSNEMLAHKRHELASKGVTVGTCELGVAAADLDINNVRGRLYNTGGLFYRGSGPVYIVPKSGSVNALFSTGIWIAGMIDGELAMVWNDFEWELWPGPLDDNGNPPDDCTKFDRLYKINKQDVLDYEDTGAASSDLAEWPAELGAPIIDGDGNPNNYDLAAGDRPDILGDQTIWWVMNDMANVHESSLARPLGIEIQVTAFAFKTADALNNTTFYRYKIINKAGNRVTDTYISIWVDPDLGYGGDDYIGSDTTLGLGYVWNGDEADEGGYGDRPPAVGFDFFQGPLVDADGVDNDGDGETDEAGESLAMTNFIYYNFSDGPLGDPRNAQEAYQYQQSIWKDGTPFTYGGNGRGFSEEPASFVYPGEPGEYWSESNSDEQGTRNDPGDRRFMMSAGPITLEPGAVQTITFGIVWSQGTDNVDSVRRLKADDRLAQAAFDIDFRLPPPPDPPRVEVSEFDGTVVLKWGNRPSDNNYLDQFQVENPFLKDLDFDDKTYSFEGYNVFKFESEADPDGEIIATFDVPNSVTRVFDIVDQDDITGTEIPSITANGTDSGLQHSIKFDDLTNYTDYYFGVQAYAYNEHSTPTIVKSAISRIVVRPSKQLARRGGTVISTEASEAEFTLDNGSVTKDGLGGGTVAARVIDPSVLTGHVYRVEFFEEDLSADPERPDLVTNYNVINTTTNDVLFDGGLAVSSFGGVAPQGKDIFLADGLSWTVSGPKPAAFDIDGDETWAFVQIQGIGDNDACGPDARSTFGCDQVGGNWVYGSSNGARDWIMWHQGGPGPEQVIGNFAPEDYEIRVTEAGSFAYHNFTTGNAIWVPFEVWDIGVVGALGVNDPSDDIQMVPVIFSPNGGECFFGFGETAADPFDFGWPGSDRIYAYYPVNDDYSAWEVAIQPLVEADSLGCPTSPETDPPAALIDFGRGRPIQRVIFFMDPESDNYREEFIPVGNIIRFLTTKPNLPGDVFIVNTEGYGAEHNNPMAAAEALDLIAVVPNPYKGVSDYELSNLVDVVRFTNMPEEATIRIFTLAGTLIRTILKNSADTFIEWNLRTEENLPIGSGMYLIHIEVPNVGEKVIKFGAIKKRTHLEFF